ncbi:LysR family transcriptional regulator [Paraburkholderia caribensis]|uniref:LysR family transcriptional regulator n=1 Tax=Paraburkholderia TaxID=1822464 RepID=UPI001CB630A9|nr:LysR family transcriptional regulator [Paraburkholderia caribensis]BEU25643.1 LysR family transcriptional regulator [Paraburkholderia sp. 22B1P]CAG9262429.1 Transcriptional regulator [Paraburkholderia caribensis]
MDTTKALSIFVMVARTRSFTQAASGLGLAPPGVSRVVAQLESHLGVRLFHRTTRRVSLTDEGQRLFERADAGLQLLTEAMDRTAYDNRHSEGTIRIAAPRSLGTTLVVPLMAAFQEQHPEIRFEIALEDHLTDLVAQRIDVGFRAGAQPEGNLIVRPLRKMELSICASPRYLQRHGRPRSERDLTAFRCTGFRHPNTGRPVPWELRYEEGVSLSDIPAVAMFNDVEAEVAAVRAGIGIGQLPHHIVERDIELGNLVPIFPELVSNRFGIFMYYAHRTNLPKRVREFVDYVVQSPFVQRSADEFSRTNSYHRPPLGVALAS